MKKKSTTSLHHEWKAIYGFPMPPHVERLPIVDIQYAIEFGRRKHTPMTETLGSDESLPEIDAHNFF